jgi:hypothetical protein
MFRNLMKLATNVVSRGGPEAPLRILASATRLEDLGRRVGPSELAAVQRGVTLLHRYPGLDEDERASVREALVKIKAAMDTRSIPEYGSWDRFVHGPVEVEGARLLGAEESAEGLVWDTRLITSGLTVDGRQFFSQEAIRNAVHLFERAQCFADHADGVPPTDTLVGWFTNPRLVELDNGEVAIDAELHVLESSKYSGLLKEAYARGNPNVVGFSINGSGDIRLEERDGVTVRYVSSLDEIASVDLVTKPAAGGTGVLKLRASVLEDADRITFEDTAPVDNDHDNGDQGVVDDLKQLRDDIQAERVRAGIERLVAQYNLPSSAMSVVQGQIEEAASVEEADRVLAQAQAIWANALETTARQHAVVAHQVDRPSREILRIQAMLAGERIDGVAPFSGLREAYSTVTGVNTWSMSPHEFANAVIAQSNGYNSENRVLASVKTTDWSYALGQAIYRELIRQYQMPGFDDWRKIVSKVSNLNDMRQRDRLRHGYFELLPTVGQEGTYQPLTDPSEERAYYTPTKRGGLAEFTWEDVLNDDLGVLGDIPRRLAMSAKLTVWYNIMNIFAAATPPTCTYDSTAVFHSDHGNLGTADISSANWAAARKAMMTQSAPGNSSMYLGLVPRYALCPPDLEMTFRQLRNSEIDIDTSGENVANPWKGTFDIIIIPFWSDTDAWGAAADPNLVPTIEVGFLGGKEEPELMTEAPNTGSHFTADKVVYKIRHVWGYAILDHRGLYKSNGAG